MEGRKWTDRRVNKWVNAVVLSLVPGVLGLQLPETLVSTVSDEGFWELQSKNCCVTKLETSGLMEVCDMGRGVNIC